MAVVAFSVFLNRWAAAGRSPTAANSDSTTFVVRRCFQGSVGKAWKVPGRSQCRRPGTATPFFSTPWLEEDSPSRRSRTPTAPGVLHPSTFRTISIVQGAPRRPQQVHCAAVAFRAFAFKSDLLRLHHPCRQERVQGNRVRFIGDLRGPTGLARSAGVR